MRVLVGVHVLGEGRHDAQRVLQAVPARDLRDERDVEAQRVLLDDARLVLDPPTVPSRRSKIAREWWWWSAARPAARSTAVTEVNDIAWFFGEKASIDGGMTVTLASSSPSHV